MANQIRFKRASGNDPGASDLVLGEPAVRTDTGELFFKKDDGSVAKVSGGVEDGDKGDITVSNSGATFTIDDDAVTYAKIQNVSATNRILGRDSSGAGVIEEITPANLRTMINVEDGATADQSASEIKNAYESNSDTNAFTDALLSKLNGIASSATNVTNNNQLTNGAGYITSTLTEEQVEDFVGGMVTGNTETGITVTYQDSDGTLDFVVASQTDNNFTTTLKNKLDGIESGATADQSASEIVALIADQTIAPSTIDMEDNEKIKLGAGDDLEIYHDGSNSFISETGTGDLKILTGTLQLKNAADNKFNILINSAGVVELYHNGSSKFATSSSGVSVTGNIAVSGTVDGRDVATDGSKLDGIASGATNVTNTNQLTNGAGFITATLTNEQVQDIVGGMVSGNTESGITVTYQDGDGTLDFSVASQTDNNFTTTLKNKLDGIAASATNVTNNNQISNGAGYVTSSVINSLNASNLSSGTIPDARFPSTLPAVDGSNLTGISAGATGGGSDEVFYENDQTVTTNYTITNGKNAMAAGPITINSGVTVTVGSGETLTIV